MAIEEKIFNEITERLGNGLDVLLPNEEVVGEPFWCIMESKNGEVTGSYYAYRTSYGNVFPIFIDKKTAVEFHSRMSACDKKNYVVRGISKNHTKFLEQFLKDAKLKIAHTKINNKNELEGQLFYSLKELNSVIKKI